MFTPQMRSEYSQMHFAELEFQCYNEMYILLKCDLHKSQACEDYLNRNMILVILTPTNRLFV